MPLTVLPDRRTFLKVGTGAVFVSVLGSISGPTTRRRER